MNKIGLIKVYVQRALQYMSLINFGMLVYLTSKETQNFYWYLLAGLTMGSVVLWLDQKIVFAAEIDYNYSKSAKWMELDRKVSVIYDKVVK